MENKNHSSENHSFNANLATFLNHIQKAILLKELYRFCKYKYAAKKDVFAGISWVYMTVDAFTELYPYMSEGSVYRWLKELKEGNWIATSDKLNSHKYDRTKWFAVNFSKYHAGCEMKETSNDQDSSWSLSIENSISQIEKQHLSKSKTAILNLRNDNSQNEGTIPPLSTPLSTPRERENAHTQETEKLNLEFDYQPAFDFLFAYLKTNPEICKTRVTRAGFQSAMINSRKALEGYLNKVAREKRWFDLTIPADEGKQFQWVAGHLAGWESYMRSWMSNERKETRTGAPPNGRPGVSTTIRLDQKPEIVKDANYYRIMKDLGYEVPTEYQ